MYTYFICTSTQDVKRPSRTRHEAPLFLAKNYFYLVSFQRIRLVGRRLSLDDQITNDDIIFLLEIVFHL